MDCLVDGHGKAKGIDGQILASLLEIADAEFVSISNSLREYEKSIPEEIRGNPETVLIDKVSLISFAQSGELMKY